uniref:AAA family ATPase n=1 Tax=Klebsiella sp. TaxID=576 RepID=UPI00258D85A5|nr:AAA family ATPase [Klebsiella sp.]
MLKGLGVENLRSFSQSIHSNLKPLTVLLGRNSSGKSSLIRLFPLLRQSVEETTTGPVLWYGRYVDYGNFSEAICKSSDNNDTIILNFDLSLNTAPGNYWMALHNADLFPFLDFNLKIALAEQNKKTYAKSVSFEIDGSTIQVIPNYEEAYTMIYASGPDFYWETKAEATSKKDYKFLPILSWISETPKKNNSKDQVVINKKFIEQYIAYMSRSIFREKEVSHNKLICRQAAKKIHRFFHHNTKHENIYKELLDIRSYSKDRLEHGVRELFKNHAHFINKIQDPSVLNDFLNTLHPFILLKHYNSIAEIINDGLSKSLLSIKYLAPIRANTERFYRFQDLQVEEMDHTGSNLAMILNSFSEEETNAFQEWTNEHFGFIAFVTTDGSHYAIKIMTDNDNEEHNISDMGYGYSQVLPIIMSIWLEIHSQDNTNDEVIFVIEQPELHLHPAYQEKVAHLFAKVINTTKESKKDVKFIFETHSQSMVDAIGECIQNKTIDKDDVNIMIFEKNKESGTSAFTATFDDEGYFTNWPVGFFSGN